MSTFETLRILWYSTTPNSRLLAREPAQVHGLATGWKELKHDRVVVHLGRLVRVVRAPPDVLDRARHMTMSDVAQHLGISLDVLFLRSDALHRLIHQSRADHSTERVLR